jgi:sulfoacetaldehyde dehydrogenase
LNYRHYLNISHVVRPLPEQMPSEEEIFGEYWRKYN